MGFADEVYALYRDRLKEEDAVSLVLQLLEDQSHADLLRLLSEWSEEELAQMLGIYLVEMLKMKMNQDAAKPTMPLTERTRLH